MQISIPGKPSSYFFKCRYIEAILNDAIHTIKTIQKTINFF